MPTNELPSVPQSGVTPLSLAADRERKLLARRRKADRTDPFASDPNDKVRRLGKLALRRDDPQPVDYLALGDLCAELSLVRDEARLLVFYAGKVLYAYRQAVELAGKNTELVTLAQDAIENYVHWLIQVTRMAPSRRNIGVTLWAVADAAQDIAIEPLRDEAQLLAL